MGRSSVAFGDLPEGCVSHVLSWTSPLDTCRSAATSLTFLSAAESDAVWGRFLPSDYEEILSRAVDPIVFHSKKDLYFRFCDPILIDRARKSFALERSTGKKCLMLSARELRIIWGDTSQYWEWISHPESRFPDVAVLRAVCWLEISGKVSTAELSHRTMYVAYLVFKLERPSNLDNPPQEAYIVAGSQKSKELICLHKADERMDGWSQQRRHPWWGYPWRPVEYQPQPTEVRNFPCTRTDGWMEVALGEFFNDEGTEGDVEVTLMETNGGQWKSGLIVQGIELRPKK